MTLTIQLFNYVFDKNFFYQVCATLLVFTIIKLCLFVRVRQKRFGLFKLYGIPGPETNLIDGNLYLYKQNKVNKLYQVDECFHKQFGKTYSVFIGDLPVIVTTDLELLRKIFFEHVKSFKERTVLFLQSPISKSILFSPYHRWVSMRRIMSPLFSSYQMRGVESVQFIEDSIKLMLDYIDAKIQSDSLESEQQNDKSKLKTILNIQDLMKATALHLISSIAIKLPNVQVKENEEYVKSLDSFLSQADKGVVNFAIKFPFILPVLSFITSHFEYDKTIGLIHRNLDKLIDDGLKNLNGKSALMRAKLENCNEQQTKKQQEQLIDLMIRLHHEGKLTREEVTANADAILFAGYDTTSTTLTYVLWILGTNPDIQETLRQELMTYGIESIYLEQVINETMRLYPTVLTFTTRLACETVQIDGLTIPQGARINYHSWLVHRNPNIWPDPLKFDPERFRPGKEIHPCAFAPFGLSDRKCLGIQLAKLEMKMITCDLLLRYRIKTISPNDLELINYANVLTKPKEKVMLELEKL